MLLEYVLVLDDSTNMVEHSGSPCMTLENLLIKQMRASNLHTQTVYARPSRNTQCSMLNCPSLLAVLASIAINSSVPANVHAHGKRWQSHSISKGPNRQAGPPNWRKCLTACGMARAFPPHSLHTERAPHHERSTAFLLRAGYGCALALCWLNRQISFPKRCTCC